tara:strand:- start:1344 stop:2513 length:1170 start_codon:yes stop_codon:yes gene_type:complete
MTLKKKDIKLLETVFEELEVKYGIKHNNDYFEEETDTIYFEFPREFEDIEYEVEEVLGIFSEIDTLEIHDLNRVTTDTITQRAVTASEVDPFLYLGFFSQVVINNIHLKIIDSPILIGIAATEKDEYTKYYPPCSPHVAVQVDYPNKESRLSVEGEEKLITSFFFEIAHSYKTSFKFTTFEHPEEFDEEAFEEKVKNLPNSIEEYNEGMDLFIKANQSLSQDLKFLTYYKVFEYFAPYYSKLDAFEAMRKKLDSSNANDLSAYFISTIFDLTKEYDESLRDKELIKSLIDNTFDLVDIYKSLPLYMRKWMKVENLEYKTKKEAKDRVINSLGNILYATRNEIVHAKSNFNPTGIECRTEELEQLNEFMHMACYSTIKWYNRLPKHLKIT